MTNKKNAQAVIPEESVFPMPDKYERYAACVFKFIRAAELARGGYPPAKETCTAVRTELHGMFGKKDATRLLAFYTEAEKNCRLFAQVEDDGKFLAAAEALRGRRKAPLMAELSTRVAFALWARAGSYAGALKLCGLDPQSEDELAESVMRYAIRRASPDLLPDDILKVLSGECLSELRAICGRAQKHKRYPTLAEMRRLQRYLRPCGMRPGRIFNAMGFPFDESGGKETKPQTDVQKWKNRAYWWLHSGKYSAMKRAANETRAERQAHE
jgi:hypothetical protein